MPIKIGINGVGRIGKLVFRLITEDPEIEVVHINDTMDTQLLVHMLKYDSVHGKYKFPIEAKAGAIAVNGKEILVTHEHHPSDIPWSESSADIVIESSGKFKTAPILEKHINNGVKRVILTCPADDNSLDLTVVIGVNDHLLQAKHRVISNASCTTNCVAVMLKVLHDAFIVKRAFMNTVHPFTNNQSLLDSPHSDFRRARAAVGNIIPTTSTAIRTLPLVMPEMTNIVDGLATRVPVMDGAFVELTAQLDAKVTTAKIKETFKKASEFQMEYILDYCDEPIVSSDIINNPHSAVFDALSTKVIDGDLVQIIAWYDNEAGYANRIIDLIKIIKLLSGIN